MQNNGYFVSYLTLLRQFRNYRPGRPSDADDSILTTRTSKRAGLINRATLCLS